MFYQIGTTISMKYLQTDEWAAQCRHIPPSVERRRQRQREEVLLGLVLVDDAGRGAVDARSWQIANLLQKVVAVGELGGGLRGGQRQGQRGSIERSQWQGRCHRGQRQRLLVESSCTAARSRSRSHTGT
uniref:MIP33670p1 n=1 Tax=Drosophila melanogaster TaxID=7227 RepID=H5V8G5_DROME|nr:MIP33670p1 [Drosophila melanogaster]